MVFYGAFDDFYICLYGIDLGRCLFVPLGGGHVVFCGSVDVFVGDVFDMQF